MLSPYTDKLSLTIDHNIAKEKACTTVTQHYLIDVITGQQHGPQLSETKCSNKLWLAAKCVKRKSVKYAWVIYKPSTKTNTASCLVGPVL